MGNVPGKIDAEGNSVDRPVRRPSVSYSDSNYSDNKFADDTTRTRSRRNTSSLVSAFLNSGGEGTRSRSQSHSAAVGETTRRRTTKERENSKECHARELIVKYDENVDGGFLAPYGCYAFEKLDYNPDIVRNLIIKRKLAPFYTPLQDFDETWSHEEINKIVDGLPLHASFNENPEEFEDVPIGNLKKATFDELIDKSLPKKEQRRLHSKIFKARLFRKRLIWQENQNELFLEKKLDLKQNPNVKNKNLPSEDLSYVLYKDGLECPICFLYLPAPMNYSKCCQQPICTECFVQIKRAEPHFPHEEFDPERPVRDDSEKDPNLLTSEPPNCPYCATPNFAITYSPPTNRHTGIGGTTPYSYKINNNDDINDNDKTVITSTITSDNIRPDWEIKLNKERSRLARRAANATAIHVSNKLINPEHRQRADSNASTRQSSATTTHQTPKKEPTIKEIEDQMLQEAIRLSLEDDDKKTNKGKK